MSESEDQKPEQDHPDDTSAGALPQKRKHASNAERIAIELSKMNLSHEIQLRFRVENDRILFPTTESRFNRDRCTWKDDKKFPCYCTKAYLKFESCMPGRRYLTRFSVNCSECHHGGISAMHLYCAYCDEVLTGSIAGPGGKISDHLVTIRHVYQQALALRNSLENGSAGYITPSLARDYIARLEEWSEKVRYPMQTPVKRVHFEEVLHAFRQLLDRRWPQAAPVRFMHPSVLLI